MITLLDEELALWRGHDGTLGLVDDRCVHRGTRLSRGDVAAACVRCPYHAWEFDQTGACTKIPQLTSGRIPAKARIRAYRAVDHGGLVWACLAEPGTELRGIPECEEPGPGTRRYVGEPFVWECQSGRQIENFLDIAHFSVIHVDVFGNPDVLEVPPHKVSRSDDGWQLFTDFHYPAVQMFAPPGPDGRHPIEDMYFEYRVELPFAVQLRSTMAGRPYSLFTANQPIGVERCRVYWIAIVDAENGPPDDALEASEQAIFLPDRDIIETQRPKSLPLDRSAELHMPFDRLAIEYRTALAEIGFPLR